MNFFESFKEKWNVFHEKNSRVLDTTGSVFGKIGYVIKQIFVWIYKLRKVFLALPVVILSVKIAMVNFARLPDMVGLELLSNGEYARMVSREFAVFVPLGLTAGCLVLMALSRKTIYPWLISLFTLVVPYLVYLTNIYPA